MFFMLRLDERTGHALYAPFMTHYHPNSFSWLSAILYVQWTLPARYTGDSCPPPCRPLLMPQHCFHLVLKTLTFPPPSVWSSFAVIMPVFSTGDERQTDYIYSAKELQKTHPNWSPCFTFWLLPACSQPHSPRDHWKALNLSGISNIMYSNVQNTFSALQGPTETKILLPLMTFLSIFCKFNIMSFFNRDGF